MSEKSSLEKKKYLKELVANQLKTVSPDRRLIYKDLVRITKYINSSVFDENNCCNWLGYVTNATNVKKGTYINFFFRNKKVAFHRLIYENYVGPLGDDYYLKFTCENEENKGKCCNVNHMLKYKYNANIDTSIICVECDVSNENENKNEKDKKTNIENKPSLIVTFD